MFFVSGHTSYRGSLCTLSFFAVGMDRREARLATFSAQAFRRINLGNWYQKSMSGFKGASQGWGGGTARAGWLGRLSFPELSTARTRYHMSASPSASEKGGSATRSSFTGS